MKILAVSNYQIQNQNNKKQNVNFGMFYGPLDAKTIDAVQMIRPLSESFLGILYKAKDLLTEQHFSELADKIITDKGITYLDRQERNPILPWIFNREEEKLYLHLKKCVDGEPTEIITLENLKRELKRKDLSWLLPRK